MTSLIGTRVRLTIHDNEGNPHTTEGVLVALAATPGMSTTPREPAPWASLVRLTGTDGVSAVIPYNACELTFLPADSETSEAPGAITIAALEARLVELDDENATLTAALAGAQKQVASLTDALEMLRSAPVETSKVAAATRPGKGRT